MATTATVSLKLTCSASGIGVSLTASTVAPRVVAADGSRRCGRRAHSLSQLISRTSRCAFEHVRSSLHRLDMARELIASGCTELQLTAPALVFSLTIRHGPFDDT